MPVAVLGSQILVLKAIQAAVFAAMVLVSAGVGRQLHLWDRMPTPLALAFLAYAPPGQGGPGHLYGALSNLFVLVGFWAILVWRERQDGLGVSQLPSPLWPPLGLAGTAAGLAIASKQDIGAYGLAALLLATVILGRSTRQGCGASAVPCAIVGALSLLTLAVLLTPVVLSGATRQFLDYAFLSQAEYVRLGSLSYIDEFGRGLDFLAGAPSLTALDGLYRQSLFLLPALTLPMLLVGWLRNRGRNREVATTVLGMTCAGFLAAFPRSDIPHVTHAVPQLLLGIAYGFHSLRPAASPLLPWAIRWSLVGWLALGLGLKVAVPLTGVISGTYQISTLPHVTGPLTTVELHHTLGSNARILADAVAGRDETFILSPSAGLYYLLSGFRNPTPFDYPIATAFGVTGQEEVIDAIREGRIRWVCLARPQPDLRPERLVAYVQGEMESYRDLGWCTLYQATR